MYNTELKKPHGREVKGLTLYEPMCKCGISVVFDFCNVQFNILKNIFTILEGCCFFLKNLEFFLIGSF